MRGHTHCRSHRDAELGPRGAGAPPRNLNALKTGLDAHPMPRPGVRLLAHQLVQEPDRLPGRLHHEVQSIHTRTGDPFKTLVTLRALVNDLTPRVANELFTAELDAALQVLPPSLRTHFQVTVWKHALRRPPQEKLLLLRSMVNSVSENTRTGKTIDGTQEAPSDT